MGIKVWQARTLKRLPENLTNGGGVLPVLAIQAAVFRRAARCRAGEGPRTSSIAATTWQGFAGVESSAAAVVVDPIADATVTGGGRRHNDKGRVRTVLSKRLPKMTDTDELRRRRDAAFGKICNQLAFERGLPVTRAELEAEATALISQATGATQR